jgi:mannose-6-phosphate isomerase-like protein (cupin superfamily)
VIWRTKPGPTLDVFGATVEILSRSSEFGCCGACARHGGSAHRHADAEDFFVLSGTQQVLVQEESGLVWRDAHARDHVRVPGDVPHAHRNVTAEAAIDLIVTTARLGQFFEEIGRPVTDSLAPPTPDELAHFLETSAEYGYLLGTSEENAAVGIEMPTFSG